MKLTSKFSHLAHLIALRVREGVHSVNHRFDGSLAVTKGNIARVFALGVLLSLGALLYLDMAPSGEAGSPQVTDGVERPSESTAAQMGVDRLPEKMDAQQALEATKGYQFDGPGRMVPREATPLNDGGHDLPSDAWRFDPPFYDDFRVDETSGPSYHQQRLADSIQERLEVQEVKAVILAR